MISRSNNDKNEGDGHKLNCQFNSETGTTLSKPLFLKECYDECWENSECKSEKCHCSPVSCSDTIENVTRVSFCHTRFSNRQLNLEKT